MVTKEEAQEQTKQKIIQIAQQIKKLTDDEINYLETTIGQTLNRKTKEMIYKRTLTAIGIAYEIEIHKEEKKE